MCDINYFVSSAAFFFIFEHEFVIEILHDVVYIFFFTFDEFQELHEIIVPVDQPFILPYLSIVRRPLISSSTVTT